MHRLRYRILVPFQIGAESCKVPKSVQYAGTAGRQRKRLDRHHARLYQEEYDPQKHTIAYVGHDQLRTDPIIVSFMKILRLPVPWGLSQKEHIFLCLIQIPLHGRK